MAKKIYFFVTYSRKQKENDSDIEFVISEKNNLKPSCIYKEEKFEGQRFYYNKIFAVEKSKKKKKYNFIFEIGDEQYIISFEYNENNTFIYDVNLDFGKKL